MERIELSHSVRATCIPGAPELLRALREASIRVGIVTRNSRAAVRISLRNTGIRGDVLLTRDDVPRTKPHPDHLLTALRMLETVPQQAMIVGDHWMDMQAGKAAGMRTVGFLRMGRPSDFFSSQRPDFVIRDLRELIEQVHRLNM
ncbi:MAG: HAD family hydrolase [Armatimonadota bacterium]